MPSSIAAAMVTECAGRSRVHWTFELTFGATTYLFAIEAVASESLGPHDPYIESVGRIPAKLGFPGFGIDQPRITVRVADPDRTLQKVIGGPFAGRTLDAVARVMLRSEHVDESDHYAAIDGVLKGFSMPNQRQYEFVLGPDERQLTSPLNIQRKSRANWQNIPEENVDSPGAAYFGIWASSGIIGATGMVPCVFVDDVNGYWYISEGTMSKVPSIFVGGVSTTDWAVLGCGVEQLNLLNADFATDTVWTKNSWTISGGVANATTVSDDLEQALNIDDTVDYEVTFTITRSAGSVTPKLGGTSGTARSAAGTYTEIITCGASGLLEFTGSGFTGTLDNVSLQTLPFTVNGRPYTVLRDLNATPRTIDDTVTCDIEGPEELGDGSGTASAMTDPGLVLRTILANYAYNDWPVGAEVSAAGFKFFDEAGSPGSGSASPLDAPAFDAADVIMNHKASIRVTSDDTGKTVVETWSKSFRIPVSWNTDFNIAPYFIHLSPRDIYPAAVVRQDEHDIASIKMTSLSDEVRSRHLVNYILNASAGAFARQSVVEELSSQKSIEETIEFTYGPAESEL